MASGYVRKLRLEPPTVVFPDGAMFCTTAALAEANSEIDQLEKQNDELFAVLEKIASLRHGPAAALARSALDTMRLLKDKPDEVLYNEIDVQIIIAANVAATIDRCAQALLPLIASAIENHDDYGLDAVNKAVAVIRALKDECHD